MEWNVEGKVRKISRKLQNSAPNKHRFSLENTYFWVECSQVRTIFSETYPTS